MLASFGFFVSLMPLPPNDFWWHLKIGQLIYTQHAIPTANLFGWTLPTDYPFTYAAWLGELLFYTIYKWGGLALLVFTRNSLALLTFGFVGLEARRRSGSWRLASLAVLLACLMTLNNLTVRPQIWSWLPFILVWSLLSRFSDGHLRKEWLLAIPLVMVFWVNVHGAFILGLILVGIYLAGESLRRLFKLPGALAWHALGWLAATAMCSGLAILVNPRFTGIIGYVKDLMTDQPSQQLIMEWQSPSTNGIANTVFYISILLLLAVTIYSKYKPAPTDMLLVIGFLWLAWSGQRYVIWYGIVTMPVLIKALHELPVKVATFPAQRNLLNTMIVLVLAIPVILVQPWFVEKFPLPKSYWTQVLRDSPAGALIGIETPVEAVEYLKLHPAGKLFNEMGYGSYLIWALPEQGVFIDPRVELYPYEQWQDYIRITNGVRYNALLRQYGASRILLDKKLQPELASILPDDPLWQLEYEDDRAQIWINATP